MSDQFCVWSDIMEDHNCLCRAKCNTNDVQLWPYAYQCTIYGTYIVYQSTIYGTLIFIATCTNMPSI